MDAPTFEALVEGRQTLGRLDRDWAIVRLLDHAPCREIRRLLSFRDLVAAWRPRVRSETRWRAFDFLVEWLPRHHRELL